MRKTLVLSLWILVPFVSAGATAHSADLSKAGKRALRYLEGA